MQYILNRLGEPVLCPDFLKWGRWMEGRGNRFVAHDTIAGIDISTVFLGRDHNHFGGGPPVLWETMIFADNEDTALIASQYHHYQDRYTSKADAIAGHKCAVGIITVEQLIN